MPELLKKLVDFMQAVVCNIHVVDFLNAVAIIKLEEAILQVPLSGRLRIHRAGYLASK